MFLILARKYSSYSCTYNKSERQYQTHKKPRITFEVTTYRYNKHVYFEKLGFYLKHTVNLIFVCLYDFNLKFRKDNNEVFHVLL